MTAGAAVVAAVAASSDTRAPILTYILSVSVNRVVPLEEDVFFMSGDSIQTAFVRRTEHVPLGKVSSTIRRQHTLKSPTPQQ